MTHTNRRPFRGTAASVLLVLAVGLAVAQPGLAVDYIQDCQIFPNYQRGGVS